MGRLLTFATSYMSISGYDDSEGESSSELEPVKMKEGYRLLSGPARHVCS